MSINRVSAAGRRSASPVRAKVSALACVALLLSGLGALLTPAAAVASPPAQGWTTQEAPLPSDSGNGSTNPDVYTASSVCPAANGCVTVGWYSDTAGKAWGLIEQQNGTAWSDTEAPQPSNAGSGTNQGFWFGSRQCGFTTPCRAVSCPSAASCVAVGGYLDTQGYSEPVIDTLSGGTWSSAEGPLPSDAATDAGPTNFPDAYLYSVACASTSSCVAVGSYRNTSGVDSGFVATLSGSAWTAQAAPLPSNAEATGGHFLTTVSCSSGTFCVAAGAYRDNTSTHPFNGWLVTDANGTLTGIRAPEPAGAGDDTDSHQTGLVSGVACPSSSNCVAVGGYEDSNGSVWPLLDTWNGSAWTSQRGPVPSDVIPAPTFQQLTTVSCGSPISCVAVGFYQGGSASVQAGLVDTLSNGQWTPIRAPLPSDSDPAHQSSQIFEIACATPTSCLAVGNYTATGNTQHGVVEKLSGASWSALAAPVPGNVTTATATTAWQARTAACASPVACTVGGMYADTAGHFQGYLDTWTGAQGYWLDATDGGIFTYPNNAFYGSTGALRLNKPMVGMAATTDGQGYWLVASDGGIFSYGDAAFQGSRGGQPLNAPIVGMASTPDGKGYWLVASDGGMFSYGDAGFFGSRGGQPLNKPIVGMAATPDGKGYWLVASDGGIFSYGDAAFYGSTGGMVLNKPVVGMASSATGLGYWLVASDGGIFSYGDTSFYGSTGSIVLNKPVVGMAASPSGKGYWFVASDGGIFNYGDAPFQGSAGSLHLNAPVVGMAAG